MQKSICKVLLLLTIACYVAEASQRRGRALLTEVTYKKTEEHKGSTPASFKSETKSEGEWTVTTKSEHTNKGPATFSYKKTHPEEKSVSTHVSEYKGSEEATKSHKGGVFTYNSGKRHFEYTEVSKTVHNFPSTVIVYDGGKPATYTHTKEVVGPAYKKEVSYSSGAGPSYSSTWTLDARKHEKEEEKEAPAAKEGAPEPKRHRRSI